ncbi:MAG: InlB B-repeat-containing protein [Lachnospiraceae bacterium]|nr:InlB B-repeat-containing protein [Lachnospiraceae bacterium]
MGKRKWIAGWLLLLSFLLLWSVGYISAEAVYEGIPNVKLSPDRNAFTTHAGDTDTKWYNQGYEVNTGVKSTSKEPEVWEHFYQTERMDVVPIGKWVVMHASARCIHKDYPAGNFYYGDTFGRKRCNTPYYSGWFAYCADCGEKLLHRYFYMSEETAKKLTYMDMSKGYYYKCPHCDNLEQGFESQAHVCKAVSANRYYVRYHANFGNGYMEKSVHMVNNATLYEGREVTPQTKLNLNTYTRKGYEFAGWNTKMDGTGTNYEDGAEIYNLSLTNNANIILYAQWKRSTSLLEIDPAGGTYEGKSGITRITGEYGDTYELKIETVIPPNGATVYFDTRGGEKIQSITGTKSLLEWSCRQPFAGKLEGTQYSFWAANGKVDCITAVYQENPIILPKAQKKDSTFAGWYADAECTEPIGGEGSLYTPQKDVTLYACWVELKLQAEDNYTANAGKGAVDLTWQQMDNQAKTYQVYQKEEGGVWKQIHAAQERADTYTVSNCIRFTGASGTYTIPYTGFYQLTLTGAQGGNYQSYLGGKGGLAGGCFFFRQGESFTYEIGGQNGCFGGGTGSLYGNGGGYSSVHSESGKLLLLAGGGGGATNEGNGYGGGTATQVCNQRNGENGEAGGGGGYYGGIAGAVQVHSHTEECRHVHTGVPTAYGGCYTVRTVCGASDFAKTQVASSFYYGNVDDNGNHIFCVRCNSDDCVGHYDTYWAYLCRQCRTFFYYPLEKCTSNNYYALGCGREEDYVCGMAEGEILRVQPAYGGSNYVNKELAVNYREVAAVQEGNGILQIQSQQIGLLDSNFLNGVTATDKQAPEIIAEATVVKTSVGMDEVRISFEKPQDRGTVYYHMVKSFSKTGDWLCTSNQTGNTLVSGVVGYRYCIDTLPQTVIQEKHTLLSDTSERPFLTIRCAETIQYLHVAAVDKAGNIGDTLHIPLSTQDKIYWPVITEQLEIADGANLYPAKEPKTYYVRADGNTPICLTLGGVLCGTARKDYQINQATFRVQNFAENTQMGSLSILVPNREVVLPGMHTYTSRQLQKRQEGRLGLEDAAYTMAKRYSDCKEIQVIQKFLIPPDYHGQLFQIIPQVAADTPEECVFSREGDDMEHSIYLIADAKGPVLGNTEQLLDLEIIEYEDGEVIGIDVTATDSGSGLAEFYIEILNLDNGTVMRLEDDSLSGKIHLEITAQELVFNGEFSIMVYAADRVGNETVLSNSVLGIGLEASIERILGEPFLIFQRGESGLLHIETIGYIERLDITFPEAFVKEDSSLKQSIVYKNPDFRRKEEVPFVIPFTVPDGEMQVLVKAYKAGTELEKKPVLLSIKVEGSILDELHTRLR